MKKYILTIWTQKEKEQSAMDAHIVLVDSLEEAIEIAKRINNGLPFDNEFDSDNNKEVLL